MEIRAFNSLNDDGWSDAWSIYESSFPRRERRSLADTLRAMECESGFRVCGIWVDRRCVGVVIYWIFDKGAFFEFLAVSDVMRGQNIGSKVLTYLCQRYANVILEIEPPEDELTTLLRDFYLRHGFHLTGHGYTHPSYQYPFEPHELVTMSYPSALSDSEFEMWRDLIFGKAMLYSDHK